MNIKPFYIRNLLFLIIIATIFICQSNGFFPEIYGYSYNLLPVVVISIAMLSSVYESVVFAFIISFLCDFNFSSVEGLSSIYFVTAAIIISFVTEKYFTKSFVTNMLFTSVTLLIQKLFQFAFYYLLVDQNSFILFFKISCAEVLIATLLCPIVYAIIYFISSKLKDGD
ncbi:MAG: hypothetical protein R3Y09_00530 [Clostridia bacterium]